ncbi:MAG: hypothetical protein ACPIOQ_50005, partial [Promethearchaeia archaeon]
EEPSFVSGDRGGGGAIAPCWCRRSAPSTASPCLDTLAPSPKAPEFSAGDVADILHKDASPSLLVALWKITISSDLSPSVANPSTPCGLNELGVIGGGGGLI